MIKVEIAQNAGFCGGVRNAFEIANSANEKYPNNSIYTYGELVHNEQVVEYLKNKNINVINDLDEINNIDNAIIISRSHGISKHEQEIIEKHHTFLDSTCIFVKRIHNKVEEFSEKGYTILIVGNSDHPEVKGISGWSSKETYFIENLDDVSNLKLNDDPILVVSQTTFIREKFEKIVKLIKERYSNVEVFDSICNATQMRQNSCKKISANNDFVIVIGGKNSSNTNKLYEIAKSINSNSIMIETVNDIDKNKFELIENQKNNFNIGITAGASTPDWIIKEVVKTMNDMNSNEMSMEVVDNSFTKIHRGEVVKGEVIYVNENEVTVNINYKADGIITRDEVSNEPVDPRTLFKQGDEIEVCVLRIDDGDGNVVLSYKKVMEAQIWEKLEEKFNNNEIVKVKVQSQIKGGLSVLVDGLNGFMPASQVSVNYIDDFSVFKGQTFDARIIDFDKGKRRLVVSKKVVDKEELEKNVEKLWETLEEGQTVKGTVQRLTDFGAFVDLGGIDGLIHISDLSWVRVKKPSEVVKVGDEVETLILAIDKERNRISLGLKQTTEEPWTVFIRESKVGDIVEGKVVSLLDFGAFIKLKQGVDGLLHVSQISVEHVEKPSDVLQLGQTVRVKITEINEEKKKISLSIRALLVEDAKSTQDSEEVNQ